METHLFDIPDELNYLFDDRLDKYFAECLIRYLILGSVPEINPALWQDVEIFIRFKKRNIWSLDDSRIEAARVAIVTYRVRYIIENLKKSEILDVINEFFAQIKNKTRSKSLLELFSKKFHASVDDLFLIQEKRIVTKDQVENFDKLFEYPAWLEFDDEACEIMFGKILNNKLTDEQTDYFLGANDDMRHYEKWFAVAKHILTTTSDSHVFWTAGDVLSIIERAVPDDEKSQKWFSDQVFEIFWPRVGSVWPILNQDCIDFDSSEKNKILRDSIGWLEEFANLKKHFPELGKNYEPRERKTLSEEFAMNEGILAEKINSNSSTVDELMNQFFELSEIACEMPLVERLKKIAENDLLPAIKKQNKPVNLENITSCVKRAIKHAEDYSLSIKKENKNLTSIIAK